MPNSHFEPYLYVPEISDTSVMIAWGGFFFWTSREHPVDGDDFKLVDDEALRMINPPRHATIGASSEAYDRTPAGALYEPGRDAAPPPTHLHPGSSSPHRYLRPRLFAGRLCVSWPERPREPPRSRYAPWPTLAPPRMARLPRLLPRPRGDAVARQAG